MRDRSAPLGLARMVPDSLAHPSMPELQRGSEWVSNFDGPVSLVWGVKDPILGTVLKRHVRALPDAKCTEVEAGHFLQEEVPDILAAAVIDLLRRP